MNTSVTISIITTDGSVTIMEFVTRDDRAGWTREANATEINKEIAKANIPAVSWRIIDRNSLPSRDFRNSWEDSGVQITHNMTKARSIYLNDLRRQRTKMLDLLDRDWMKAFGQGNTGLTAEVEAHRQALRDFPVTLASDINAATTPAALKLITLE